MKQVPIVNAEPQGTMFHLTPECIWREQSQSTTYVPEAFAREGFVHCTNGEPLVLEVGNRYYREDQRTYLLLDIDLSRITARCVYEDPDQQYPHIYGPIEREAVVRVRRVDRAVDGEFVGIGQPLEVGDG